MKCDLCSRKSKRLLRPTCANMVERLLFVDRRMRTREVCEAERLAQSAAAAQATMEKK